MADRQPTPELREALADLRRARDAFSRAVRGGQPYGRLGRKLDETLRRAQRIAAREGIQPWSTRLQRRNPDSYEGLYTSSGSRVRKTRKEALRDAWALVSTGGRAAVYREGGGYVAREGLSDGAVAYVGADPWGRSTYKRGATGWGARLPAAQRERRNPIKPLPGETFYVSGSRRRIIRVLVEDRIAGFFVALADDGKRYRLQWRAF